jgi:hypothetical protein
MGVFLRDERAWFRRAGVGRFAHSKGGHLHDEPHDLRTATIQMMETALLESMATEHGMVLQNLALMTEALGLGGFPNFARHEYSWFKAIGFRMHSMPASRYAGAPRFLSALARWFGREPLLAYPIGLEKDNRVLLKPFCPPYYKSMGNAVRAFVQTKFGADGTYRGGAQQSATRLLVPPKYRRRAPRRCKRRLRIVITSFAATDGFPPTLRRSGRSSGSRSVA